MIKIDWQPYFQDHIVFGLYHYEGEWLSDGAGDFYPTYKCMWHWRFALQGIIRLR